MRLQGQLIGKAGGNQFSEDYLLQDSTGLIYLNDESAFGWIGNLIFAGMRATTTSASR